MALTKVTIEYQSNYNGCSVICYFDGDHEDGVGEWEMKDKHPDLLPKVCELQDAVINEASINVIKEGRNAGLFNGDIDDLEDFAILKARELFGDQVEIAFEEDDSST